jgi:hypothetical protein
MNSKAQYEQLNCAEFSAKFIPLLPTCYHSFPLLGFINIIIVMASVLRSYHLHCHVLASCAQQHGV